MQWYDYVIVVLFFLFAIGDIAKWHEAAEDRNSTLCWYHLLWLVVDIYIVATHIK